MGKLNYSDAEIETIRQECLAKWNKDRDHSDNLEERYGPKSFGHHEALHTAYVQMEVWESYVMEHHSVVRDPELFRQAHKAFQEMWDVYQLLGAKQE